MHYFLIFCFCLRDSNYFSVNNVFQIILPMAIELTLRLFKEKCLPKFLVMFVGAKTKRHCLNNLRFSLEVHNTKQLISLKGISEHQMRFIPSNIFENIEPEKVLMKSAQFVSSLKPLGISRIFLHFFYNIN